MAGEMTTVVDGTHPTEYILVLVMCIKYIPDHITFGW